MVERCLCKAEVRGSNPLGSTNLKPHTLGTHTLGSPIGPWFLWKLIVDRGHQRLGYGAEVVHQVAAIVRAEGATELLTSYVPGGDGPGGFYERLGFAPTGEVDGQGEIIVRLPLA